MYVSLSRVLGESGLGPPKRAVRPFERPSVVQRLGRGGNWPPPTGVVKHFNFLDVPATFSVVRVPNQAAVFP